jgi:hypothetical protein
MNNTRRTSGFLRSSTALGAATLLLGSLALGACSKTDAAGAVGSAIGAAPVQDAAAADGDSVDLVNAALETPSTADPGQGAADGDRKGLRAKLLRALHATWVTSGPNGPVTHRAIRGEVTAVSATSITVKAKDGVSLTYAVTPDTTVRARARGKGTDSTIGAVTVGAKALVTGVGASNPTAHFVVFRSATPQPAASPAPSATS